MDTTVKIYEEAIVAFLEQEAQLPPPANMEELKLSVVIDRVNYHYLLTEIGWNGKEFIYTVLYHFDIIDSKVWLQRNTTENEIVDFLQEHGIPKSDIVIGFRPPEARTYQGFAAA